MVRVVWKSDSGILSTERRRDERAAKDFMYNLCPVSSIMRYLIIYENLEWSSEVVEKP